MQCGQCQAENPPQAKFCMECAAPLARQCGACGAELPARAKFCVACAHPVSAPTPAAVGAPAPAAYTPQHLAERIISSRGALEGERKQVTVLFADLKGSMELLADRDPEEARRLLDPVLERMMEAVHRYEGTVNQVLGDGIMALFGAPLAHEDHAVRACYAALRMQETVKQYADEVRRREGVTLQIRVGLNSGEVVVRSIGSDLRIDYTAVGQTTHLAARMEQVATPGSILLAPDTLQLAEGYVQVSSLGPIGVKGLSEPVAVYELIGAGMARSRLQAAAVRGLTKFVGRDAELETLRRTLEQAGSGQGQVVALVGEPGVGKSRLVWEFSHSHRTEGWLVLASGSVSYGKATSYLPVIDLLKAYCGIEDRDDARRIREKLTGKLLTLDPALQTTLPAFHALLDLPVEDPTWEALDPPQRRQLTLDAYKRLLLRESQEQPLLLVCEDLHWIDAETQALLDSLVDSLPTARILLLVNYRPEYEHGWHRKTYYQQLRLDPLPPQSAETLLAALLGASPELAALKGMLVARTEGNPFFVEESVRALVEDGVLVGERGAYRLARPFEQAQVPATVQAVLAARIDRLAPEDKHLLQSAAVIGKDLPYTLLQAIAELAEAALRESLARLQAAEFLYETSLFPDLEYTFKHALTHEVAYGSLLHERRRALHARIVKAAERLYSDRPTEQVERLAQHSMQGEVWPAAVSYSRQAGRKALDRSAHREATKWFEQALAALDHLPSSRASSEQAIDLRFELRDALQPLMEFARAHRSLDEAQALAEAIDDRSRLAQALSHLVTSAWADGDWRRARELGARALALATEQGDVSLQVGLNFRLGNSLWFSGDYEAAINSFRRNAESLRGNLRQERFGLLGSAAGLSCSFLAACLAERGEFTQAITFGEDAIGIGDEFGHAHTLACACFGLGEAHLGQGNLEQAIAVLERGVQVCEDAQIPLTWLWVASTLGSAYAAAGRATEAVSLLERVWVRASTSGHRIRYAVSIARLSEAHLLAGCLHEALIIGRQAHDLALQGGARGLEASVLRLLAEIAAHADPPAVEQAEDHYHQALALADELGMHPLVAHCHLGRGTLYQHVGRDEQAHTELATAAAMYRAMEMPYWLEKAEASLALVAQ